MRLPKRVDPDGHRDFNQAYCSYLVDHYKFQRNDSVKAFTDVLSVFGNFWNLSYRDLEKAFIHFAMAQPIGTTASLAAYLVALKLKQPEIFHLISVGNKDGHNKALPIITKLMEQYRDHWLLPGIQALHHVAITGKDNKTPEFWQNYRYLLQGAGFTPESIMTSIAKRLDIAFVE